jgi:hypothetical protein
VNPLTPSSGGVISHQIGRYLLFTPLIGRDQDLEYTPFLARSWELNEDTTVLTLHLRDGLYWHDGVKIANSTVPPIVWYHDPEAGSDLTYDPVPPDGCSSRRPGGGIGTETGSIPRPWLRPRPLRRLRHRRRVAFSGMGPRVTPTAGEGRRPPPPPRPAASARHANQLGRFIGRVTSAGTTPGSD